MEQCTFKGGSAAIATALLLSGASATLSSLDVRDQVCHLSLSFSLSFSLSLSLSPLSLYVQALFNGLTAVQVYAAYMSSFAQNFAMYFNGTISEVEIGLGPAGEMRYPSYPSAHWQVSIHHLSLSLSIYLSNASLSSLSLSLVPRSG
eukprot:TRINITY_DN1541_c0_g1_i6.p2 TRINITY_DN1541_c0_g1~~TRINITY_DN1541_c0_g1_i6.p2  ORF type:complete len:147 (-),score=34.13 TRINITY_DN1541_c0_g1_i6:786-1226(-)